MTTLNIWTGTELNPNIDFTLLDPDGVTEHPARAALMPGGAYSVDRFLEIEGATIAHRGSYRDWAEFSMRAYTESVAREVDALEISVSRSSDGIWFGLHDDTLLRTSGIALDPKVTPWREIQRYRINPESFADPAFGPRPYIRLSTLLKTYAHSHLIFVDPKYHSAPQWQDEFYEEFEIVRDSRQHIVIKGIGGSTFVPEAAAARGYISFGSFYEEDYAADPVGVLEQAARWDWINLQFSAPQSTWDAFAALGKPMTGHIARNRADYDVAIAKGATSVMCSGIRDILGAPVI